MMIMPIIMLTLHRGMMLTPTLYIQQDERTYYLITQRRDSLFSD